MKYTIERIISDNKNFLVLEVTDEYGQSYIAYVSRDLDLDQETFSKDELQMIVWGGYYERKWHQNNKKYVKRNRILSWNIKHLHGRRWGGRR